MGPRDVISIFGRRTGGLAGLGVFGVQMRAMCCFAPPNFAKFLFSEIIDAFKTLPFARTTRLTEKQKSGISN